MFHIVHENNGFQARFSASLKNVDLACHNLERFLELSMLEALSFDLILGAREILNNCVIHGSHIDNSMTVQFSVFYRDNALAIEATDEGPGFDYETQSADCDVTDTCGRGHEILNKYFDSVRYRLPGNRVELHKNIKHFKQLEKILMSEIFKEGDRAVVKLEGDIISTNVEELKTEFKQLLQNDCSQISLNLESVKYIDSMGLGLLVATHNSLQKNGNRLQLSNVSSDIAKLLKQTRLDTHFDIT